MSNSNDVAMWALTQGDQCPALATIQAALAQSEPLAPLPPGVDTPTSQGDVAIAAVKTKFPYIRWLCFPILNCVPKNSAAHFSIARNCQNAQFEDNLIKAGQPYLRTVPYTAVPTPGGSTIGGEDFRLTDPLLHNVRAVPNSCATMDEVVAWILALPAA
jgi:hypothetical protein